ncbi:MAG: peptidase T [Treponema sp.]|nr:peptidase T [Treponema sp.]
MDLLSEFATLTQDRFIRYVQFDTTSDKTVAGTPSTQGQWDLARALGEELRGLGLNDITLTEHCYLIARLEARAGCEHAEPIAFFAHLDTAEEVPGKDVKPQVIEAYDGSVIQLSNGLSLDPAQDGDLAAQGGRTIIHSDGSTLLGADNKAGIAVLVGLAEYLQSHPEAPHGPIEIVFSPDEELVRGLPHFPREMIRARAAYTLDEGGLGNISWECFNAWLVELDFFGVAAHVGGGRGRWVSAAQMASVFGALLPRSEGPEASDGSYGYCGLISMAGDLERAVMEVFVRDFDTQRGEEKIKGLEALARSVEAQFPGGRVELRSQVQYVNSREKISEHMGVVEKLRQACRNRGIEINEKALRSCTDGSFLTALGLPTPNIFSGGRRAHSRLEWLSVQDMAAACTVVLELCRLWTEE